MRARRAAALTLALVAFLGCVDPDAPDPGLAGVWEGKGQLATGPDFQLDLTLSGGPVLLGSGRMTTDGTRWPSVCELRVWGAIARGQVLLGARCPGYVTMTIVGMLEGDTFSGELDPGTGIPRSPLTMHR